MFGIVNTKDLFLKPQVMKFMDLIQFKTTQVIFKASHNMLPSNIQHFFENWERRCDLRGRCSFKQPRVCSTLKNSLWNELHKDIKQSGNIAQYKNKSKQYIFDGFIYWGYGYIYIMMSL